ncbi:hypothetical protein RND81_09G017000 [Saponaria officinalis]|uniref:NAC domain-containing protein n=1 Tax=Saponaria officinalis TaxID=3572 RepID=A0AAW1IHM0_SAPOF
MDPYFLQFDKSETNLPPGFRFHPTDEELITYYLLKKVLDCNFTGRAIAEVDLNKCEPWQLPEKAKMGEKEWYFYSLRDRKYPTGLRTNRATEAGYWKATGKDREIHSSKTSSLVGMKKTLVFYRGRAPKGEKSNWVMHEYRLEGKFAYHYLSRTSKDEWVISRVFQKTGPGTGPTTSTGATTGPKKARNGISLYSDVCSSPSSVSQQLPPLLDSSPYGGGDCCSFDNNVGSDVAGDDSTPIKKEHVSCFSMINNNNTSNVVAPNNNNSNFNPFELNFQTNSRNNINNFNMMGLPAFPSLRSLQENLTLPWVGGPAQMGGGGGFGGGELGVMLGGWGGDNHGGGGGRMGGGGSELDCMWTY